MLEVLNLKLVFPGSAPTFDIPRFFLEPNERVTLTGASGRGKTLFLRSICKLEPSAHGEIWWKGEKIEGTNVPSYRSHVIYVGQRNSFSPGKVSSAFEEVFMYSANKSKKWILELTIDDLKTLGKESSFLKKSLQDLSGGEKQLVQLLRAVALEPDLLCLDEPTSALDLAMVHQVETWLKTRYKGTWIWVTHDSGQADRMGEKNISHLFS